MKLFTNQKILYLIKYLENSNLEYIDGCFTTFIKKKWLVNNLKGEYYEHEFNSKRSH